MKRGKTSKLSLALSILLLPILAIILSFGAASAVKVDCPDDFMFFGACAMPDGTLLLSGSTGPSSYYDQRAVAAVYRCDLAGNVLWEYYKAPDAGMDQYDYTYHEVALTHDGDIAALLSGPTLDDPYVVEYIRDGNTVKQVRGLSEYIPKLVFLPDGLLLDNSPDFASGSIIRLNDTGEVVWQLIWPERMRFSGMLAADGIYIAYGCINIQSPDGLEVPSESVIIAIDDDGKILWRRDIPNIANWNDCLYADGRFVLAGDFQLVTERDERWGLTNGVIMAFDPQGNELFKTQYVYADADAGFREGRMFRILPTQAGYVACVEPYWSSDTLHMVAVDLNGAITAKWDNKLAGVQNLAIIEIVVVGDEYYAVVRDLHLPEEEDEDEDDGEFVPSTYSTTINRLNTHV